MCEFFSSNGDFNSFNCRDALLILGSVVNGFKPASIGNLMTIKHKEGSTCFGLLDVLVLKPALYVTADWS